MGSFNSKEKTEEKKMDKPKEIIQYKPEEFNSLMKDISLIYQINKN